MSEIFIVVARARNGVIGRDNQLPWRLPEDLRHFRRLTLGKPVIMGRKTFESIGTPLPNRRNIVLTRNEDWHAAGIETAPGLDAALARVAGAPEIGVIGGEAVFAEALPRAARLEITEVHAAFDGDARFPPCDEAHWNEAWREDHPATDGLPAFSFRRLLARKIPAISPL